MDFICFGIGRLDLLAPVKLSRDPGLSDGAEPDIRPTGTIARSERVHGVPRGSWHLSAHQLCEGPKGSGPHVLWPSAFPPASSGGWGESVITNVLWPSQRLRRAWDLVPLQTRAQLLGEKSGRESTLQWGCENPHGVA